MPVAGSYAPEMPSAAATAVEKPRTSSAPANPAVTETVAPVRSGDPGSVTVRPPSTASAGVPCVYVSWEWATVMSGGGFVAVIVEVISRAYTPSLSPVPGPCQATTTCPVLFTPTDGANWSALVYGETSTSPPTWPLAMNSRANTALFPPPDPSPGPCQAITASPPPVTATAGVSWSPLVVTLTSVSAADRGDPDESNRRMRTAFPSPSAPCSSQATTKFPEASTPTAARKALSTGFASTAIGPPTSPWE